MIIKALRSLTPFELRHALAIEPGMINTDGDALTESEIIVSVCAGSVTIEEEQLFDLSVTPGSIRT